MLKKKTHTVVRLDRVLLLIRTLPIVSTLLCEGMRRSRKREEDGSKDEDRSVARKIRTVPRKRSCVSSDPSAVNITLLQYYYYMHRVYTVVTAVRFIDSQLGVASSYSTDRSKSVVQYI